VRQAAAQVPCNPKLLYAKVANGEVRAIRLGPKAIRVRQSDLNAFIAARGTIPDPSSEYDYIERLLTTAPPLTEEQRSKLAALLRPGRRGREPDVDGRSERPPVAAARADGAQSARAPRETTDSTQSTAYCRSSTAPPPATS
jgi:hypothetical protein